MELTGTTCVLVALFAQMKWKTWHLYVKLAFLNGILAYEICLAHIERFVVDGSEDVHKLHKALYGLKQAPRAWYNKIDTYLCDRGFRRSESDANLYVIIFLDGCLFNGFFVDDLLLICNNQQEV